MLLVVLIIILIIAIIYYFNFEKIDDYFLLRSLKKIMPFEQEIKIALIEFKNPEKNWYISDRQYRQWKIKYSYLIKLIKLEWLNVKIKDPFKDLVFEFYNYFNNGRKLYIDQFNDNFIKKETPVIKKILDEKNIKNNYDQINAIASDEDHTLLVAGAGTGKTTTILGKLVYLVERVKIKPEEILLLSFTRMAVEELNDRIKEKFDDVDIKAKTFHSFGQSIIAAVTGKKPSVAFKESAKNKFINEEFNKLLEDNEYLNIAIKYFAYYFKPVVLEPGFQSFDEYYKYIKTEENLTFLKEKVKSQQEVMIANFLFLNGITYDYEKSYKFETADRDYKQYRPDFFLPEYDIYIEHFGINRNNETRYTRDEIKNKEHSAEYFKQMEWKRELHNRNRTILIETYSYEFIEKNWQENLKKKLMEHGIRLIPKGETEVKEKLGKTIYVKKIVELFDTFLGLSKSNGYSIEDIHNKIISRDIAREILFFKLFKSIYKSYEKYLKINESIDFHDMLINATNFVNNGKFKAGFKYIIIDEFQDFSVSKYNLIKALCTQNQDAKLFCVGDDWQSIFRFTGSDISLMTEFENKFGFTKKDQLIITNRFNDNLARVTNKFILRNPHQIIKEVRSLNNTESNNIEILSKNKNDNIDTILREILNTLNNKNDSKKKKPSVYILGRYQYNSPPMLDEYKNEFKKLNIQFLTIHSSKGLESDYVIILDVVSGRSGFPTGIDDDPILNIVLSEDEYYPHAECD